MTMKKTGCCLLALSAMFLPLMSKADTLDFAVGKALFDRVWISSPASTDATDGLGPYFNARSCVACHPRGGRGNFTEDEQGKIDGVGLILRLGDGRGAGDPRYGIQLQTQAVQGLFAEGRVVRTTSGTLVPTDLNDGPLHNRTRVSGRLAPSLRGVGLLEMIPAPMILAAVDAEDSNHDDVSGRANMVMDGTRGLQLGRFGWKAGKASVRHQSAAALSTDLGLSNPLFPNHAGDCTRLQTRCLNAPHGDSPRFENLELSSEMVRLISVYVAGLRAPDTSNDTVGDKLFDETGCAACHQPTFVLPNFGVIAPYTDLLLHNMGPGLADGIGDGSASGDEWRTSPLWGLNAATRFLHDGRASTLDAAIILHGGEAEASRDAYTTLSVLDRDRLLSFLSNL